MIKGRFTWTAAHFAAVAMTAMALTTHPASAQQDAGADPMQIDHGKMTFAHNCSHCHGPNMVNAGTIAPDLRRFPDDKERFFTTVKSGKNGKMPPWGDILNDDEIAGLWAYLASRRNP